MKSDPSGDPEAAPIFVVGSGRSGTSLVRAMLNAHPAIHLAQESMFLHWTTPVLGRRDPTGRLEAWLSSFSFRFLGIDPDAVRAAFPAPLSRDDLARVHGWTLRRVAERHGATRWGDKSPPDGMVLGRLYDAFGDARVIHVARDPRGALVSLSSAPFTSGSRVHLLWAGRLLARRLAAFEDRIHTIRLEDLKADPEATMRPALDFVGEPWDDAVLHHADHVSDDDPPYPWTAEARRPIEERPPRWPERLDPAWIRIVERSAGERMARLGYAPAELDEEPSRAERLRAVLADLPEAARFLGRAARLVAAFHRAPPDDPDVLMRLVLGLNPRAWEQRPEWEMPVVPRL